MIIFPAHTGERHPPTSSGSSFLPSMYEKPIQNSPSGWEEFPELQLCISLPPSLEMFADPFFQCFPPPTIESPAFPLLMFFDPRCFGPLSLRVFSPSLQRLFFFTFKYNDTSSLSLTQPGKFFYSKTHPPFYQGCLPFGLLLEPPPRVIEIASVCDVPPQNVYE